MTFHNYNNIYCKQNLKEEDRKILEFCEDISHSVLDAAYDRYREDYCAGDSMMLDEIKTQIVDCFIEEAKTMLGFTLQEHLVSLIDNYEEDVDVVGEPEMFYYQPEDVDE